MMPHPERASDPLLGHTDGQRILRSILASYSTEAVGDAMAATVGPAPVRTDIKAAELR